MSFHVPYVWTLGENRATCTAQHTAQCSQPPGPNCHCGFWALWSPLAAMSRDFSGEAVLGLISGYGAVAFHGEEGFRAEFASLACVFTDRIESEISAKFVRSVGRRQRQSLARALGLPGNQILRRRDRYKIGEFYGVPCLSIKSALSLGLLEEFGVRPQAIWELRQWVLNPRTPPPGSSPPWRRPRPPAVSAQIPLRLRAAY